MLYGSATGTATDRPLDVYVDPDNGNDGNIGTRSDLPLATLAEAERRIPDVIAHRVTVHLAGSSTPYDLPSFRQRTYHDFLVVVCDRGGDQDDGFDTVLSGVAQAGSNVSTLVTSGGLGVNTHRGRTLLIESGDASGDRRFIAEHTDTDVDSTHNFSAAIQDGDSWRIVESAATLRASDDTMLHGGALRSDRPSVIETPSPPALVFVNVKMDDTNSVFSRWSGNVIHYGVEWVTTTTTLSNEGYICAGRDDGTDQTDELASLPVDFFGAPSDTSWVGWGWSSRDGGFVLVRGGLASLAGVVVDRFPVQGVDFVTVTGFNFYNFGARIFGGMPTLHSAPSVELLFGEVNNVKTAGRITGSAWGVLVEGIGSMCYVGGQAGAELAIDATGVEGVVCEDGGSAYIRAADITADVTVLARQGGIVAFNQSDTIVTAATAETRVEDPGVGNTDATVASYGSVGDYNAAGDGSKVYRLA